MIGIVRTGGEGGIRTLDTGFSPYNGLANSARPLPVARNQSVRHVSDAISRAELGCSADDYAPQHAPRRTEIACRTQNRPGQLVTCSLGELRAHPSYVRHQLSVSASQLCALTSLGNLAFREPIAITRNRTIIDGYARFQLAQQLGRKTIVCIEYDLSEEEALRWLIQSHRPSKGMNAFNRVLLALDLEPVLRDAARANQQWGGQNKGSSSLAEARSVDVRAEIATVAGVSPGNVDKVRKIVESAHPRIQQATKTREISIHRAWLWSRLPAQQQLTQLDEYRNHKGTNLTTRRLIQKHVARLSPAQLVPPNLGDLLGPFIPDRSARLDSIAVTEIDAPGSIAYLTKDALRTLRSMEKSKWETGTC